MNVRSEIAAIVAGTVILAGGVVLELAGKVAPPELWVAGTAALTGGVGLALPAGPSSSAIGELERLAGYVGTKAPATAPESAPAASSHTAASPVDAKASPSASAAPAPAPSDLAAIAAVSLP